MHQYMITGDVVLIDTPLATLCCLAKICIVNVNKLINKMSHQTRISVRS